MQIDEQALVLRVQAGDKAAFSELIAIYQRRVYGVAMGVVRNQEDAMDITQEAFVKVHKNIGAFRRGARFYTWLYRIVVNLCIDHLRKQGRRSTEVFDENYMQVEGDSGSDLATKTLDSNPEDAHARAQLREKMQRALDTLSPDHRAAIVLREIEGLSYHEIATTMKCSKGTVMSRLFHARKRMQMALKEALPESTQLAEAS